MEEHDGCLFLTGFPWKNTKNVGVKQSSVEEHGGYRY